MSQLTEHFTLGELCVTHTNLPNRPAGAMVARLTRTAEQMERVRTLLNDHPIHISSAYRSPAVNAAVGGSKTSAHVGGFAVDFICPMYGTPREIVHKLRDLLVFDQLIWEHPPGRNPWVHISFDPRARQQVLEYDGNAYTRLAK